MTADERNLLAVFRDLDKQQQTSLLSYAEFLRQQAEPQAPILEQPHDIPASANESVVAALRRLSKSYFMLEEKNLLNAATNPMSQHVIQGRDAMEVINELEQLFKEGYDAYVIEIESQRK